MSEPKIYAPINAKHVKTASGFNILKMSANVEKLIEFLNTNANDKGWINLDVTARKETGKYGETHSVCLNTWKPDKTAQPSKPTAPASQDSQDDVPF